MCCNPVTDATQAALENVEHAANELRRVLLAAKLDETAQAMIRAALVGLGSIRTNLDEVHAALAEAMRHGARELFHGPPVLSLVRDHQAPGAAPEPRSVAELAREALDPTTADALGLPPAPVVAPGPGAPPLEPMGLQLAPEPPAELTPTSVQPVNGPAPQLNAEPAPVNAAPHRVEGCQPRKGEAHLPCSGAMREVSCLRCSWKRGGCATHLHSPEIALGRHMQTAHGVSGARPQDRRPRAPTDPAAASSATEPATATTPAYAYGPPPVTGARVKAIRERATAKGLALMRCKVQDEQERSCGQLVQLGEVADHLVRVHHKTGMTQARARLWFEPATSPQA
jgi:hypothetical protein